MIDTHGHASQEANSRCERWPSTCPEKPSGGSPSITLPGNLVMDSARITPPTFSSRMPRAHENGRLSQWSGKSIFLRQRGCFLEGRKVHYILSTAVTRADLVQLLQKAGPLANWPDLTFVPRENPSCPSGKSQPRIPRACSFAMRCVPPRSTGPY